MNEINKFIAGLNDFQKKLLVIALVFVMIAFFDRLLIGPTTSRLSTLESDILKEKALIKQDIRFLSYKDKILKQSEDINPYLTKNISTDEEMIAAFLKKIENLALRSKVALIKVNPAPGQQEANFWKYQADVECTGNLGDVIAFMHLINVDTELMKVDKFNFNAKKSDTDEIKATMTIEKVIITAKPMPVKAKDTNAPSTPPAAS